MAAQAEMRSLSSRETAERSAISKKMLFKPVVDQISACAALPAASERC